jgi:microcystin-dependent protein
VCDGTNHEAALYPDLMAVLGVPNADTFAVPDLQGRSVVARGRRSSGEVGGAESVTLTALQSGHTHMVAALSSMATGPSPRNNLLSFASANKVPFSLDPGTVV